MTAKRSGPVRVAVLMGSDSDLPTMKKCFEQLDAFGVAWDAAVASAHRTPERVVAYIRQMEAQGVQVFIGAASGAAHLAGVIAAHTTLPVIAVPLAVEPFRGLDSLLAMVQMPPGYPAATVAAGDWGATNAGVLAAQIIALTDESVREKLKASRASTQVKIAERNAKMRAELGLPPSA